MRELIEAVQAILARSGIDNTTVTSHYLYIGELNYYFWRRRGRTVDVEGESFRGGRDQALNIANHIVSGLKERLAERKARKELERRIEEAAKISEFLKGTDISVKAFGSEDRLELIFRHPDKSTIMAAADLLQDSGFARCAAERVPEADEEAFTEHHLVRLFNSLTPHAKARFFASVQGEFRKFEEKLATVLGPEGDDQ